MVSQARLFLFCALCSLSSGCVDPVADLWLLTDYRSTPTINPAACTYYANVEGYLDVDAEFKGSLDYSFECGGGYEGSADIVDVVALSKGSYEIEFSFTTGDAPTKTFECEIVKRTMTCVSLVPGEDLTYVFERGDWFDNSPS